MRAASLHFTAARVFYMGKQSLTLFYLCVGLV